MNDEIKEILENQANGGYKDLTPLQAQDILDYITNLQQENQTLQENNQSMQEEMARTWQKCDDLQQENERLNNCIDDQERVINSLIDKRDLYKINYNDYKSRCEKASDNLKRNYWINEHEHNDDVINMTLNILQNGSEEK